jgi:serine/threonine protein kinase
MKKPEFLKTAFSEYAVKEALGQGGNGIVFRVERDNGESFAAKILNLDRPSQEKIKRFRNEIHFCQNNENQHIVQVYDYGLTETGAPFFIMPLFSFSLRKAIKTINSDEAIRIFIKILDGIQAAHELGVTHRDIKPENILTSEDFNELVIADFGIANFAESILYTAVETKNNARMANFQYAAPEQRERGQAVGFPADIFALGLILNELFTKKLAHGTNFTKIGEIAPNYAFLDTLVEKMLVQDPEKRISSVKEIKDEIALYIEEDTQPDNSQEEVESCKLQQLELVPIPVNITSEVRQLLSGPNNEIALDSLIDSVLSKSAENFKRIEESLTGITPDNERNLQAISNYERSTAPLFPIVCLLSRYGNKTHEMALEKIVFNLSDSIVTRGGFQAWASLKWLPLHLILYAGGISSLVGKKWDNFKILFSVLLENEELRHVDKPVYFGVAREMLELRRLNFFKNLPGHERHHVPQSEYTYNFIKTKINETLSIGNSFDRYFDFFEIMYALIYADTNYKPGHRFWGPLGRFSWKYNSKRRGKDPLSDLIQLAQKEGASWAPLQKGFFNSSLERFLTLSEALATTLDELSWF